MAETTKEKNKIITRVISLVLSIIMLLSITAGIDLSAYAAGNSMSTATSISLNTSNSGSITSSNTSDFYKFTLDSSGRINIVLTSYIYCMHYYIYDSDGETVWQYRYSYWNDNTKQSSIDEKVDLTKGTYYFAAVQYSGTGNYNFEITFTTASESFSETKGGTNNSIATANSISLGTSYKGQIAVNDNTDIYKFALNSSGEINLVLTAYIYCMHYYIYDSDGETVWQYRYSYWNDNTKQSSINEKVDLTKGTYYFAAVQYSGTGNYNFKISFTTASESFSETKGGTNNSIATASKIALGTSYNGQIAANDNSDFYKLTLSSSGEINLVLTASIYCMNYYIYDSNGGTVWDKRYVYWNDNNKKITIDEIITLSSGTYYFAAVQNNGTGNYSFTINCVHNWNSGTVTKASTCTATGTKKYTCSACGATKTETIAKKAHSYDSGKVTKAATYTATGTKKYTCTVCGATKTETIAKKKLSTPKISAVNNINAGVKITWGKVSGAEKYRVLYKTSGGSWTKLADTTSTSYTWKNAKSGTKYYFTVQCVSNDGKTTMSSYDTTGKAKTYIAAPKISAVNNINAGVKITWGKVNGAAKYRVLYKTSGGSWIKIADTTSTSYTWKNAKSGTKYYFTVKCISSDGKTVTSGYDSTGKAKTYIAAPKISAVNNTVSGVKITWGKVTGAAKYRVLYKTSGGSWTKLTDTTSTSYTWKNAKSGTKYYFTVKCVSSDGKTVKSGYDSTGKVKTYIAAPKISAVNNIYAGVKITWGKVNGAAKYRVLYKTGNGSWTKIADTTSTSYTWKNAKSGTKYYFTVKCVSSDGKTVNSGYDSTGKAKTYIAAPKISALSNTTTGIKISWGKVTGAAKYRVFYKTGNGSWTKLTDTTSTSYTWKKAKSGTKYYFTVKCISSDGKTVTSGYDSTGKSITFIAAPKISSLSKTSAGVQIKWGKVTGAAKYKVFRKTANGKWQAIGTTTSTNFVDNTAKKGTKYTYTVRCVSKNGKSYTSAYNGGKSITR